MPKFISQKKTSQTSSKYSKSIAHVKKKPQAKIKIPSPVSESQNSDTDENLEGPNSEVDLSEEGNDEDMDVDQNEAADSHKTSKSGSTARESHQSQRLLQAQRKATKPNSALLTEAKRVWATARKIDLPKAERQASIQELMRTVRGKVKEIVFKHDASRIIQTLVRYGGQEERNEVAEELKGSYVELSQNKYSKFLVIKLIRYCSLHRSSILSEFHGHVLRLLLHREASQIISDAFELYASSSDRSLLIRDFYGKEVSLFDSSKLRGEENGKSGGLATVLDGVGSDRRKRVLTSLKENLMNIFNNPDKGAVGHSIVHHALWEYLHESDNLELEAEREKARREIFESSQEVLAELVHTRDGSRCVRAFLAYGTAKDRKQIVKILKPHLKTICQDDCAQLVLFTALDVIDDTKLVVKSFVSEMVPLTPTLVFPPISPSDNGSKGTNGRRSLLYLITPRDPRHFTPAIVSSLAETDPIRDKVSKKDNTLRASEIRESASPGLLSFVVEDLRQQDRLLRDPAATLLLTDIMLYCVGDKAAASEALIGSLSDIPYSPDSSNNAIHLIDLPHSSRVFKTLLQGGHYSHQTKSIIQPSTFSAIEFARIFCERVGKERLLAFSMGNGAFVMTALVETYLRDGTADERRLIKSWFDANSRDKIKTNKSRGKGKDALLSKVDEL